MAPEFGKRLNIVRPYNVGKAFPKRMLGANSQAFQPGYRYQAVILVLSACFWTVETVGYERVVLYIMHLVHMMHYI